MAAITYQQLESFGDAINNATDARDATRLKELDDKAASYCEEDSSDYGAYVWYFRSNIQAALQDLSNPQSWEWRQKNRERQILYLRRAANHRTFVRLAPVTQASIFTNLGNSLSSFGRGIEAIELYDAALQVVPQFAMALGNRGSAMHALLRNIPDPGHAGLIAAYAHANLKAALSSDAVWQGGDPSASAHFAQIAVHIGSRIDPQKIIAATPLDKYSLGRSKAEKSYRRWALDRSLFLNPLTVIGPHTIAATDRMNIPPYITPVGEPPTLMAWFNQMKQEFVAARWFLYEGTRPEKKHFVDRETFLVNTLDYPAFGIQVEKLRAAFRIAYGLLDKVAGFINAYYELGMVPGCVDIRNIWHTKKGEVRPEFLDKPNLALRGLYWLALDIIGDNPGDQDSIAPEAAELKRLRNVLEHRSLVLRQMDGDKPMGAVETVSLYDFKEQAMHVVRLARAALMYLAFSMRKEELDRRPKHGDFVPAMELPVL
ncbi:MAG: LA2681 family HEPN domain-containing protein [Terriglobales bacterium]